MISQLRTLIAAPPSARAVFDSAAALRPSLVGAPTVGAPTISAATVDTPTVDTPTVTAPSSAAGPMAAPVSWRRLVIDFYAGFYRDRLARRALIVCALVLAYGGGAVMFWVHAIFLGEGGPSISPYLHWALDSTAGFIGLTPPLAVILPLAARFATLTSATRQFSLPLFIATGGAAFSLVTLGGPIMHDTFIARGTWIADRITEIAGRPDAPAPPPDDVSHAVSMTAQLVVGLPAYTALFGATVLLIRLAVRRDRRRG